MIPTRKYLLLLITLLILVFPVFAHPGGTDGSGGHTNRSTGEYHYHHGYEAHSHYDMDGDGDLDCPYNFKNNSNDNSNRTDIKSSSSSSSKQYDSQQSKGTLSDVVSILYFIADFFILVSIVFGIETFFGSKKHMASVLLADYIVLAYADYTIEHCETGPGFLNSFLFTFDFLEIIRTVSECYFVIFLSCIPIVIVTTLLPLSKFGDGCLEERFQHHIGLCVIISIIAIYSYRLLGIISFDTIFF